MKDTIIGVDLAKRVFQVHGSLTSGQVRFRKKLSREQFRVFMAAQPACLVVFEACGSASYWAREMEALGHEVKLIAPQYVHPFVKRQKNDAADAEAWNRFGESAWLGPWAQVATESGGVGNRNLDVLQTISDEPTRSAADLFVNGAPDPAAARAALSAHSTGQ